MSEERRPTAPGGVVFATVAIDVLCILAFLLLLPRMVESFRRPSTGNGLFIIGSFMMLLIAVAVLQGVESGRDKPKPPRRKRDAKPRKKESGGCLLFVLVCVLFAYLMLITMILGEASGWYPSFSADEDEFSMLAFVVFVVALLSTLAALGLGSATKPAGLGTPRGAIYQILGVVGVDLITLVTLAWWSAFMGDPGAEGDAGNPLWAKVVLFGIFYILFLTFYAPPRIYLFLANRDRIGLATFLAFLAAYDWHLVTVMKL